MAEATTLPATTPDGPAWHSESVQAVLEQLKTHREHGLSTEEAKKRLAEHGYNELREKPPTPFWRHVVDQLKEFVVLLLIAASLVSFLLGDVHPHDLATILDNYNMGYYPGAPHCDY